MYTCKFLGMVPSWHNILSKNSILSKFMLKKNSIYVLTLETLRGIRNYMKCYCLYKYIIDAKKIYVKCLANF